MHLGLDAKTGQVCAVLMTHPDVIEASVVPELLAQLPPETTVEIVGGDGAYDTKAARAAIEHIAQSGKQDWKDKRGYHCRSLVDNLMDRFKTLTGDRLWARDVDVQDAQVAVRVGILNRMMVRVA